MPVALLHHQLSEQCQRVNDISANGMRRAMRANRFNKGRRNRKIDFVF